MTAWTEDDIQGDGVRLHYHRTGGGKHSLLLLHGITDNGLCWTRVARHFEREYDVIMPDARGHGRSGGVGGRFSAEILADDTSDVIRTLDLDRPIVYGHSMGAVTALALAARHPGQVRAIMLEDPPLFSARPDVPARERLAEERAAARRSLIALNDLSREERIAQAAREAPEWVDDELQPWADAKEEVSLEVMEYRGSLRMYPWRDALSRIACPILLLTGDVGRGAIVTPDVAADVEQLSPNARAVRVPGAGHSIHRDRFAETMKAISEWLRETPT